MRLLDFVSSLAVALPVFILLTLPGRLFSSINRNCLWQIRDGIFDARRQKKLPDSAAVDALIERAEAYIALGTKVSPLEMWWLKKRYRHGGEVAEPSLDDMTLPQRQRYEDFSRGLNFILMRQYMTGSWSGLLFVAPRQLRILATLIQFRQVKLCGDVDEGHKASVPDLDHEATVVQDMAWLEGEVGYERRALPAFA